MISTLYGPSDLGTVKGDLAQLEEEVGSIQDTLDHNADVFKIYRDKVITLHQRIDKLEQKDSERERKIEALSRQLAATQTFLGKLFAVTLKNSKVDRDDILELTSLFERLRI